MANIYIFSLKRSVLIIHKHILKIRFLSEIKLVNHYINYRTKVLLLQLFIKLILIWLMKPFHTNQQILKWPQFKFMIQRVVSTEVLYPCL